MATSMRFEHGADAQRGRRRSISRSHESGPYPTEMFLLGGTKQPGLVSQARSAGGKDSCRCRRCLRPAWQRAKKRAATEQPDTVADQLRRAGDIETNPGPAQPGRSLRLRPCTRRDQSSDGSDGRDARTRARNVARRRSGSQPDSRECKGCRKKISKAIKHPMKCKECKAQFHDNHSGENRSARDKIRKYNKAWTCPYCRLGIEPPERRTDDTASTPKPGQCMAARCGFRQIKRGDDYIACTQCKGILHKKRSCSEMTAKQIVNLNRDTWKCDGCLGIWADELPQPDTASPTFKTNSKQFAEKLTILQWNADAITPKIQLLRDYLIDKDVDVFLIQETKLLKKDNTPTFPGYIVLRRDRRQFKGKQMKGGGLLTGVKEKFAVREAKLDMKGEEDEITESLTIEIQRGDGQKLRITNVYIPPIRSTASEIARQRKAVVKTHKWPCKPFDCVLGDFNAHSPLWGKDCDDGDARGHDIEEWMATSGMLPLNDLSVTRNSRSANSSDTAPDISIVHSSLIDKFSWKTDDDLGSDHKPILILYEGQGIPEIEEKARYKWKLKDADWEAYQTEVEDKIPANYWKKTNVNKLEKRLRKIILTAANKHVKKKKITNKTKPGLTPEIKEASKERNRLRGTVATNRREWVEACNKVRVMVKENREESWKEYVENLDMKTNPSQVWQTIRSMEGKNPPKSKSEVLEVDGVALVDNRDKANAFAKTYRSFSKLPVKKSDRAVQRSVRKGLKRRPEETQECEQDITMNELNRVIDEAGLNKAAGEDDIPYELVKHLGKKAREMLLHIYNQVWAGKPIPANWRTAVIKTLLKEGKDPKITSSYRPISLTACLGKLMEKIVADRMTYVLENRGLLADSQAGFRQNRCTTDQVLRMTQIATDQIQATNQSSATIVTFFDYEKAYDKVWRAGLLHKMQEMSLPYKFIQYTRSFLSGRKTTVEVNGTRSNQFILKEGLPQGSSISPLLFLVFINDIGVDLHPDTIASLFADDTAIGTQFENVTSEKRSTEEIHADLQARTQEEVTKITNWADKWKMAVNGGKTKTLVISSNTADTKWEPELVADIAEIQATSSYKFLGVTIDSGLFFNEHVKLLIEKCRKRVRVIKCMAWKEFGNSLEVQRTLYLQWVRSCLEYASPSWREWISPTNMLKLERVQNEALRAIGGLAKTCPVDLLRLETNIEPLEMRLQKTDEIAWDKYKRLPTSDARRTLVDGDLAPRLATRHGWRHGTKDRAPTGIKRDETTPPVPPWRDFPQLKVDYVTLEKKKSDYTPETLRALSMAKIESFDVDHRIYTDGSTSGDQTNGGAGVLVEDNHGFPISETSYPAGAYCSSFTGESVAFLEAIRWIKDNLDNQPGPLKVLICSDSMSLAQALDKKNWKDIDPWIKDIKEMLHEMKTEVTLLWIPSHCDIEGNEVADELARQGTEMSQEEVVVTHKIIKAKIRNRRWEVTHERAKALYQQKRSPNYEVERKWPKGVRTLFARLRTDHDTELRWYRKLIEEDEENQCDEGCDVTEDVEHVLCECVSTLEARRRHWGGTVTISMMVSHPDVCRKILATRFGKLRLPNELAESRNNISVR